MLIFGGKMEVYKGNYDTFESARTERMKQLRRALPPNLRSTCVSRDIHLQALRKRSRQSVRIYKTSSTGVCRPSPAARRSRDHVISSCRFRFNAKRASLVNPSALHTMAYCDALFRFNRASKQWKGWKILLRSSTIQRSNLIFPSRRIFQHLPSYRWGSREYGTQNLFCMYILFLRSHPTPSIFIYLLVHTSASSTTTPITTRLCLLLQQVSDAGFRYETSTDAALLVRNVALPSCCRCCALAAIVFAIAIAPRFNSNPPPQGRTQR
jgi:hypothetical protein